MGLIRRNGRWYARLNVNGRDVRKSLGTSDEAEAKRLYAELAGYAPAAAISLAQRTTMTQLVDAWLARKRVTSARKPRSIKVCEVYGRRIKAFFGKLDPAQVTADKILEFQACMLAEKKAPRTINLVVGRVLEILRLAQDRDLIQKIPRVIKQTAVKKDAPKVLTDEEIKALFKEPSGFFLHPLLMVCLHCGLRLDEALHLQWSDVDLGRTLLHVRVKKDWSPKNHQPRTIPMNARLVAYLKGRKNSKTKQSDLVCARFSHNNTPWTPLQVTHHVRKLWQRAGIYERGKPTMHALRHTFATRYLQAGGNLADLQRMLGHSNVSVTSVYLWANEAGQREGVEALGFGSVEDD